MLLVWCGVGVVLQHQEERRVFCTYVLDGRGVCCAVLCCVLLAVTDIVLCSPLRPPHLPGTFVIHSFTLPGVEVPV